MEKEHEELLLSTPLSGVIGRIPNKILEYGDFVTLYGGYEQMCVATLEEGRVSSFKMGNFRHSDIVGKRVGTKIYDSKTSRWVAVLHPTAELITLSVPHHTQILYHADISVILMLLNAIPGKFIVESGTGSGSLSTSIARAIAPSGHLYTYDCHDERCKRARNAFESYGLNQITSVFQRNVCLHGFGEQLEGKIDAIFLDLPTPWSAAKQSKLILKPRGFLVNFSPCIEQVQKLNTELKQLNFLCIRTWEVLCKPWGMTVECANNGEEYSAEISKNESYERSAGDSIEENDTFSLPLNVPRRYAQYQLPMKPHTGYLSFAMNSSGEEE